jgi:hypothetical protein
MPQRDDEYIEQAIDDFFEKIGRFYADGEPWEQHFPRSKNGA